MDETTKWLLDQAEVQAAQATAYEDRAFFLALRQFIQTQATRLEQAQGEVDGRSWDHRRW
ncbi:hypothetical protein [Lacticaseibacillus camelliae]|uniref:Uncharacterized protein n=1 Tax=Lacticaseibacillus camelliae DSM 22697 = JCM 13995 TaxID=1423730 RepID=A0A0R2EYM8_9LACO|nr:hypothetical protein [Lacticaseibacillus camelliae]KRN21506.1 hypothetical protein FC75_GL002311 [Lacticaseibacillus camelliae DSM 22697 = JCM 13995]